jgi:hypothetical protein
MRFSFLPSFERHSSLLQISCFKVPTLHHRSTPHHRSTFHSHRRSLPWTCCWSPRTNLFSADELSCLYLKHSIYWCAHGSWKDNILRIPPELRLIIYKHYFISYRCGIWTWSKCFGVCGCPSILRDPNCGCYSDPMKPAEVPVFPVCRTIHQEARDLMHNKISYQVALTEPQPLSCDFFASSRPCASCGILRCQFSSMAGRSCEKVQISLSRQPTA